MKLQMIGVVLQKIDDPWMRVFRVAENFFREYGNLDVPTDYVAKDGTRLGAWISKQRGLYRGTSEGKHLSDARIQMLESIGMVRDVRRRTFEKGLRVAQRYYEAKEN